MSYGNKDFYCPHCGKSSHLSAQFLHDMQPIYDNGPNPLVTNIDKIAEENTDFRRTFWTGPHFQLTLMSIPVGGEVGLEIHANNDQFFRVVDGDAMVFMGDTKDNLPFKSPASEDDIIIIPADKWHNIVNIGDEPLKLYAIYAPPHHPFNTIHKTKQDSDSASN